MISALRLRIERSEVLFPEGPKNVLLPNTHVAIAKCQNVMITEQFYSHILNTNRGSIHTRSFRRIHLSVFTADELKMAFRV